MSPVSYVMTIVLDVFKYYQMPPLAVVVMVSESSSENRTRQVFETCPECGGQAGPNDGFIVCKECGLTLGRELRASHYQIYDADRGPTKAGTKQYTSIGHHSLIVDDLGSHVGYSDGRFINHNARKLKRTSIRSRPQDRLTKHVRELLRIGGVLSISRPVLGQAITVLKKALPHWKSNNGYPLALSCLTYAIREFSVPILESEVLEVADRPRNSVYGKSLKRAKFYLVEELGLRFKTLSPLEFLPHVLTALRSSERVLERLATYAADPERVFAEIEARAREVLSNLTFADYQGKKPMHLAVSCCYVLSSSAPPHVRFPQALIAEACGISIGSISAHHKFWKQVLPAKAGLQRTTMAISIIQFIRLLLSSPGMTREQMRSSMGLAEGLADTVIRRLIDSNILAEDESGLVSVAPQETPGQIKVIQLLADRGWDGAIKALVEEYLEVQLKRTGKPLFRVKDLKKSVRKRIPFLEGWELRPRLNAAIEGLKNDGAVEQWDGDIHKINCPLPEHQD